jgi:hypothetical protein
VLGHNATPKGRSKNRLAVHDIEGYKHLSLSLLMPISFR